MASDPARRQGVPAALKGEVVWHPQRQPELLVEIEAERLDPTAWFEREAGNAVLDAPFDLTALPDLDFEVGLQAAALSTPWDELEDVSGRIIWRRPTLEIRINGMLDDLAVGPDSRAVTRESLKIAILGLVSLPLAVLPFIDFGRDDDICELIRAGTGESVERTSAFQKKIDGWLDVGVDGVFQVFSDDDR